MQKFEYKECDGFELVPYKNSVDMDVHYTDYLDGYSGITLDAIEVYKILREYFKGVEFDYGD